MNIKKLLIPFVLIFALCLSLASCGQKAISSLEIIEGFKYSYELNETPDLSGIQVQVKYNDGTFTIVGEKDLTITGLDTSTPGQKSVTVSYNGFEVTAKVTVAGSAIGGTAEAKLTEIAYADGLPEKLIVGDALDTSSVIVIAKYDDGTSKTVSSSDLTFSAVDTATAGEKQITITYKDKSATATVNVLGVKSITLITSDVNTLVMKDATVDLSELKANVVYTDDSTAVISLSQLTVDAIDTATCGEKTVSVSYKGTAATFTVKVDGIKEIEIVPSSVNTVRPEGDDTPIDYSDMKLKAVYYFSAKQDITYTAEEITVTQPDWSADEKYFSVTYAGFTAKIMITETDPVIEAIEIVASSVNGKVKLGDTFSTEGLQIEAIYSNGSREVIALDDEKLAITLPDTSAAGTATLSVIYDEQFTATASVTVISIKKITVSGLNTYVLKGEEFSYDGIVVTLLYSDDTTVEILKEGYEINKIDTSVAGDTAVTVTYKGITSDPFAVNVAIVSSVQINSSSFNNSVELGQELNYEGLTVLITLSNGKTMNKTLADGVRVDLSKFDSTLAGNTYITASYADVTSAEFAISVKYVEKDYYIGSVELPESLVLRENAKKLFKDQNAPYVVGDDNPFIFKLTLLVFDSKTHKPRTDITDYVGVSEIYLDGKEITDPVELAKYVIIDEKTHGFDFSENAIGKTFTIKTRPLFVESDEVEDMTKEITVNVIDAYNVYTAAELNVITNYNGNYGINQHNQLTVVDNFLKNHGIDRPATLNGIVLHNDIKLTTEDIPSEYLITLTSYEYDYVDKDGSTKHVVVPAGSKAFNDHFSVFRRQNTDKTPFNFNGNYFTINSSALPCVAPKGQGENTDWNSATQLFKFEVTDGIKYAADFSHTDYKVNIENLYMNDDDQTDNENANSLRHLLGLIGIKVAKAEYNVTNVNIHRFFISFFCDYDWLDVNIDKCDFYNSWQNHIMSWAENDLDDENSAPRANHKAQTINITASRIAKCGGPVIIAASDVPYYPANTQSHADYNISADTEIYSYVTGQEAWFTAVGATTTAAQIKAMNPLIAAGSSSQKGFITNLPKNGNTEFINIIMINMVAMEDASNILGTTDDIDGSLTIGGNKVLDMNDPAPGQLYGNQMVAGMKASALGAAPILYSSAGGIGALVPDMTLGAPGIYDLAFAPDGTPYPVAYNFTADGKNLDEGKYMTIYIGNLGVVLGYNMEVPAEGKY